MYGRDSFSTRQCRSRQQYSCDGLLFFDGRSAGWIGEPVEFQREHLLSVFGRRNETCTPDCGYAQSELKSCGREASVGGILRGNVVAGIQLLTVALPTRSIASFQRLNLWL